MAGEHNGIEDETIGQLLRAYRVAAGLTQSVLAQRASVGEQTIGYLERDLVRRPQQETLKRLIVALELSADEQQRLERARRRQPRHLVRRAGQPVAPPSPGAVDKRAIPIVDFFIPRAGLALAIPSPHLVTLTGPSRETTLVAQAARDLFRARGFGNVRFVSLAGVDTPTRLPGAILAGIAQGAEMQSTIAALLDHLRSQHLLLILDRCEQLLESCATLIDTILQHCPQVCVLATCTEPLHVEGEVVRRITPLA